MTLETTLEKEKYRHANRVRAEMRGSAASQVNILHQQHSDPPAQEHLRFCRGSVA